MSTDTDSAKGMEDYTHTFASAASIIKKHQYDVRAALEALPVCDRTSFLGNAFDVIEMDEYDLSANRFRESFSYNLPHILWMFNVSGNNYYGLSELFSEMSKPQHDLMRAPEQAPDPATVAEDPIGFLIKYYNHETDDFNIVWALENLPPEERAPFIETIFQAASERDDVDLENLKYTLSHQLPHIVHMLQEEGQLYRDLGHIVRTMREHDMVYAPSATNRGAPIAALRMAE